MAWQKVPARHGRGKGGQGQQSLHPELQELAREVRAALLPQPHAGNGAKGAMKGGGRQEKPEWMCAACGTYNFMTRTASRQCV